MRSYAIKLSNASGAPIANFPPQQGAMISGATFCSVINNQNDPGALDVELDIFSGTQATPTGGSFCRVYGISLQQIAQASNLNNAQIQIWVGMSKGLPLANPAQIGLVADGTVYPGYGNYIGTNQTLDLILKAPFGRQAAPLNFVHNQSANSPLSQAIQNTLSTALPTYKLQIAISPNLVSPAAQNGFFKTLTEYATFVRQLSQQILGTDNYNGVQITSQGSVIKVFDGTQTQSNGPKQIAFQDLVGQPTWLGLSVISVTTVMRGDIGVGDKILMPQTVPIVTAASAPQFRQNSAFQGTFVVTEVRCVGRSRAIADDAWVTVLQCASSP